MKGEELYRIWRDAHLAAGCDVDDWHELDEFAQTAWAALQDHLDNLHDLIKDEL